MTATLVIPLQDQGDQSGHDRLPVTCSGQFIQEKLS